MPPKSVSPLTPSIIALLVLYLATSLGHAAAILFPYGANEGDQEILLEKGSETASVLHEPFAYFEHPDHRELFISPHGAISLSSSLSDVSATSDLDTERKDIIAVFYAPSRGGKVFYRSSHGGTPLSKEISAKIRRAFDEDNGMFEATSSALITWEDVGNTQHNASNSYQLALASNGRGESYVVIAYHKIEWFQSEGRMAQAGFFSSDGRSEKLVNSGTAGVVDLIRISNFNEAGLFLYKVSGSQPIDPRYKAVGGTESGNEYDYLSDDDPEDYDPEEHLSTHGVHPHTGECPTDPYRDHCPLHCNVVTDDRDCALCICSSTPDSSNRDGSYSYSKVSPNDIEAESPNTQLVAQQHRTADLTCSEEGETHLQRCHLKASCLRTEGGGHCCECQPGYYGNGLECLLADKEQRISGSLDGAINGKQLDRQELHTYIDVKDGQQHIALPGVPEEVAKSLMVVDSIGHGFGWLFASASSDSQMANGFQLAGGVMNRSVSIHIGERYSIVLREEFTAAAASPDTFDVKMVISGTVPTFATSVTFPDFEIIYQQERPGFIRAYTERHVDVMKTDGKKERVDLTMDEQIHFQECSLKTKSSQRMQRVKYQRISVNYGDTNNPHILRFASKAALQGNSTSMQPSAPTSDQEHRHSLTGREVCANACSEPNMHCTPTPNSYKCECDSGYEMQPKENGEEGFTCKDIDECKVESNICGENEDCENLPGGHRCLPTTCQPGYVNSKDGTCVEGNSSPSSDSASASVECTTHQQCHQWGECVFSPVPGRPGHCKCRGWYVGDGVKHCGPPEEAIFPLPVDQQATTPTYQHGASQGIGTMCRTDNECGSNAKCQYSHTHGYYKCECQAPFKGDGADCVLELGVSDSAQSTQSTSPAEQPTSESYPCEEQEDCHSNAHCVDAEAHGDEDGHVCRCLPGFEGDGKNSCTRAEECSPAARPSQCTEANTQCQYSSQRQKFTCQCREGYHRLSAEGACMTSQGAGSRTCKDDRGICHNLAECLYNNAERAYSCVCRPGTTGDGSICYPAESQTSCFEDQSVCSPNAECVPSVEGTTYVCNCKYGYEGDGRTCEESTADSTRGSGAKLLIARGVSIIQRHLHRNLPSRQLVAIPHQIVVDLAYDCRDKRIYWSDISGHSIRSTLLNGTDIKTAFESELKSPEGIAIDANSRNLYYADSIKNEIGVVTLDGRYQKRLVTDGLANPRALAIDLRHRQLYYSDWQRTNPRIGRLSLDGTGHKVFLSEDIHLPNGLALLPNRNELCWVDAGNQRLSCVQLDGTRRRVVYAPLEYPFGLTCLREERFYWTDWRDHKVHTVSVYGEGYTSFLPGAGGRGKLYGLLALDLSSQCSENEPRECAQDTCPHMCLPPAVEGDPGACTCPDNASGLEGC